MLRLAVAAARGAAVVVPAEPLGARAALILQTLCHVQQATPMAVRGLHSLRFGQVLRWLAPWILCDWWPEHCAPSTVLLVTAALAGVSC